MNPLRSLLFVPAHRPDRFPKAIASGADAVIFDLEDAVPPADRGAARAAVLRTLEQPPVTGVLRCVRINSPRTPDGLRDLLTFVDQQIWPEALVVPKVEGPSELRLITEVAGAAGNELRLLPLIETARALSAADAIAAHPRVTALLLGGADLAADLGATMEWDALRYARGRLVHAAATAGRDVLDVPYLDLGNDDGFAAELTAIRPLGFTGKLAIHPKHVGAINTAFTPTPAAVAHAERLIAAARAANGGVCQVDGRMVDAPIIRAAERTLARRPR